MTSPLPALPIKIGYTDFRIEVLPDDLATELGRDGDYSFYDERIRIQASLPAGHRVNILTHELVHALLTASPLQLDEDVEESVALALGTGFTTLFKDNPHLLQWLAQELHPGAPLAE